MNTVDVPNSSLEQALKLFATFDRYIGETVQKFLTHIKQPPLFLTWGQWWIAINGNPNLPVTPWWNWHDQLQATPPNIPLDTQQKIGKIFSLFWSIDFLAKMQNLFEQIELQRVDPEIALVDFKVIAQKLLGHGLGQMSMDALNTYSLSCPICEGAMIVRKGLGSVKYVVCSQAPACSGHRPFAIGVSCPLCQHQLVERKSASGKKFYGCEHFPECNFTVWAKPVTQKCINCDFPIMMERFSPAKEKFLMCPQCRKKCPPDILGAKSAGAVVEVIDAIQV